jgi:hypothetical protein
MPVDPKPVDRYQMRRHLLGLVVVRAHAEPPAGIHTISL